MRGEARLYEPLYDETEQSRGFVTVIADALEEEYKHQRLLVERPRLHGAVIGPNEDAAIMRGDVARRAPT
jgi:hypothetical protein